MSDVKLFQTYEDGEIEVKNGVVTMDGGLTTAMFISLFGAEDWWGNLMEPASDRRLESNTMKVLRESSLNTGTLQLIEDAVTTDLAWVDGELTITASIPQLNRVQIDIDLNDLSISFTSYANGTEPQAAGELIIPEPPSPDIFEADTLILTIEELTV